MLILYVAKKAEYDEQQCFQMCDNSPLYEYFKKTRFFRIFSSGWTGNPDCFALKQIPHIGGHFKTLTFKIGGLGAEKFGQNHKSIPIYNSILDEQHHIPLDIIINIKGACHRNLWIN